MPDNLGPASPAAPIACPSCEEPVARDHAVCPHCGALVHMESAVSQAGARVSELGLGVARRIPRPTLTRRGVLWLMAAFPLVIGPTVLALLYAGFLLARGPWTSPSGRKEWPHLVAIAVVAGLNIGVSLVFWDQLSDVVWERGRELIDLLFDRDGSRTGQPI